MRTSPAFTLCPSCTWIARTTPVSSGCMTLVRLLGMIRPDAVATISTLPKHAHARAKQNNAMMVPPMAPAIGGGGVSTISSAAGKKASSSSPRTAGLCGRETRALADLYRTETRALADFMDACLQTVERRIATACLDQGLMGAVLNQTATVDGDEAVAPSYGRQPVRDDEHCAAAGKLRHILLNDPLALIVERARRLVEDQDARVGNKRACDGQTLALAAGQAGAPLAHNGVVTIGKLKDEIMGAGRLCGRNDPFDRHRPVCQRDVVAHRAIEQDALLQHYADLTTQPGWIDHAEINTVDQNPPTLRHVEPLDQLGERAFAGARWANNAHDLSGRYPKINVVQHLRPVDPVAKRNVLECDVALD